jgi:hypothetical protein
MLGEAETHTLVEGTRGFISEIFVMGLKKIAAPLGAGIVIINGLFPRAPPCFFRESG